MGTGWGLGCSLISEQSCGDQSPLSELQLHPTPPHPTLAPGVSKMLLFHWRLKGSSQSQALGLRSAHYLPSGAVSPLGAEFCPSLFELKEVSWFSGVGETQGGEPSMSPESLAVVGGGSNREF